MDKENTPNNIPEENHHEMADLLEPEFEESFIDFIDGNFETIKIAGCTRATAFGWVCK